MIYFRRNNEPSKFRWKNKLDEIWAEEQVGYNWGERIRWIKIGRKNMVNKIGAEEYGE